MGDFAGRIKSHAFSKGFRLCFIAGASVPFGLHSLSLLLSEEQPQMVSHSGILKDVYLFPLRCWALLTVCTLFLALCFRQQLIQQLPSIIGDSSWLQVLVCFPATGFCCSHTCCSLRPPACHACIVFSRTTKEGRRHPAIVLDQILLFPLCSLVT